MCNEAQQSNRCSQTCNLLFQEQIEIRHVPIKFLLFCGCWWWWWWVKKHKRISNSTYLSYEMTITQRKHIMYYNFYCYTIYYIMAHIKRILLLFFFFSQHFSRQHFFIIIRYCNINFSFICMHASYSLKDLSSIYFFTGYI